MASELPPKATRQKPGKWQKRLMDLPVQAYRLGLGFLFGERLAVLVHTGRKSGLERRTTLEVLQHRRVNGEYCVLSGWGPESDWYRNISVNPPVALWVGRLELDVTPRVLPPSEAAAVVADHLRKSPRLSARISPALWAALQYGIDVLQEVLADRPVVAFRPAAAEPGPSLDSETRLGHRRVSPQRLPGVGIIAALEGVGLIIWNVIATPFIGRSRQRWGTVGTEPSDSLPGDELITDPKWMYTLGIGIDAPPERVWPWVAQIGQGRGGFYSYQTLENMLGCKITNTAQILPEFQDPHVDDEVYLHPTSPPMKITTVEPPRALVLFGAPADLGNQKSWAISTWQFVILPQPDGSSRLLSRGRSDYTPGVVNRLFFGHFPMEPITFTMNRKMLLEIKRLAERE